MISSRKLGMTLVLSSLALTQVGCLFGAASKTTQSGNVVAANTFSQIEPGKTTSAFVKGTLGTPDSQTKLDDGTEIWRWSYTERTQDSGFVFLIFGGTNEKVLKKSAYVQVKDGLVIKAWRE
jgi:outer membrane protein assembly factor BamE (lipoprotein component of BamABCDE complex)